MEEPAIEPPASLAPVINEERVEEIVSLLRAGRRLPAYLVPYLFELPREYQLAYAGKSRREDILAETMAIPLQPERTYWGQSSGWSNMLIFGDNLQVLRRLLAMKQERQLVNADDSAGVRLCYIDPPFASRREFLAAGSERAYQDRIAGAEFVEHLRQRLILIHEVLADDGVLYVHLDTRKSHYAKVVLDEIFGEQRFENEVIWKRTNARSSEDRWPRVHDSLLVYSKSGRFHFVPEITRAESSKLPHTLITGPDGLKYQTYELTAPGRTVEGDSGRPWRGFNPSSFGRHWANDTATREAWDAKGLIHWPRGGGFPRRRADEPFKPESRTVPVADVWTDIDRLNQADRGRIYPTQKPDALLTRIVRAHTNVGDVVLDCFAGSSTTAVVAEALGRRWVAVDSGKFAIYASQRRLLRTKPSSRSGTPFVLYNAGLYDYNRLRDLDWADYRRFVMQLFECRDIPFKIGGVPFDGYLRDDPVLVYEYNASPEAQIGLPFVRDIRSLAGPGLGKRCYVIAPAMVIQPYEDYLDVDGTRFYFLRIPYSVIEELHRRAFRELRQPSSEALTNSAVDAVGFDFIQPPSVETSLTGNEDEIVLEIESFATEAFAALPDDEPFRDLAMVLVDLNYDGVLFDMDDVYWADDLLKEGYRLTLPRASVGERAMFVFVDVYGNEHRELVKISGDGPAKEAP